MSGFTSTSPDFLVRGEVWSTQLKDVLQDELMAQKYVNWLTEFPDGDTFTIPSISGQMQVDDYEEDTSVMYHAMDTGEFQFQITEYLSSGTYITNKQKQDSFYMSQLTSSFIPAQHRAIMARLEKDILALESAQTASNLNTINGAAHRFVGSGTNEAISVVDFARALHSLKKANVPQTNLVAIVDPSVEYSINTITNLTNISNNPMWEGIVTSGIATGMRFVKNIYGFDVYTSNYLADANETISGLTTTAGKANLFFSAAQGVAPFVGAWRQMPKVDSKYNQDFQREEHVTTARYGVKLYRPENLVVCLTDTDVVA
jgi:hypothetical protein